MPKEKKKLTKSLISTEQDNALREAMSCNLVIQRNILVAMMEADNPTIGLLAFLASTQKKSGQELSVETFKWLIEEFKEGI